MNNAIGGLTTGIIMKSHIFTSHLKLKKKKISFCSVPWILELLSTIHAPFHSLEEPQGAASPVHAACLTLAADILRENHWPVHSNLHLISKLLQGEYLFLGLSMAPGTE